MGRGLWNLRVDGCWYRLRHPRIRVSPPEAAETVHRVKQICNKTINLEQWDQVPFPTPLDSYFDFVSTIDQDAGTFTLSKRPAVDGVLTPQAFEASLAEICEVSSISVDSFRQTCRPPIPISEKDYSQFDSVSLEWNLPMHLPTAMIELQQQFFLDFIFLWRSWIDDPITWHYGSRVFNAFSRAILRLISSWQFPEDERYWFHGFLIMLEPDLESPQLLRTAIARAKAFIDSSSRIPHEVRSILISPRHVAFVELSQHNTACSEVLPLLTDSSATQCSPGFRKWPFYMPSEVLLGTLHSSEPRDALSFAQASFEAERWYYATVPQFRDVSVQNLDLSIPCCGDRTGLEDSGVHCSRCGTWQHQMCIGLETLPSNGSFICAACLEKDPKATRLTAGGINRLGGRAERRMCAIKLDGSAKSLRVRLSQPAHLRPELRLIRDLIHSVPKGLIDFTIRFNGVFAGLAYGVEPDLVSLNTGEGSGQ
ncbi:unnamed protein product [Penicillium nalgiovense]|nr:unnamed protein product [Penicillium nalgiovense]